MNYKRRDGQFINLGDKLKRAGNIFKVIGFSSSNSPYVKFLGDRSLYKGGKASLDYEENNEWWGFAEECEIIKRRNVG